ncbi:DNA-directed RNA polymerases I, II, and III subunit [Trichophyton mentagrophytes]|uniref:DNA-directed RNA polymerase I, II, and III subunit RPABC4 n=3 Tax=Trichophyton TaxID=5550 RepID=A0A059JGX2_TRIIM|nr:metallothionein-I transcription activator [Trichophyton tonsurans CBS 112818]EGE08614.1 metallothionein-I transcription activator [Trichophyton equinum CBS 127.97]EZF33314.1 hypothetical protein H101_03108 [Trichophyton interdigitale H6]KAG5207241.1 Metallothionein-I, transcription activator [Trichophyton interdigitale]KDB27054.1 hypothetical protein H109_01161 [Trichophyton interdigitale MR816]GBF62027.1 DNA-directed RNA polymerases I, II, and III subunit [Trichophyton mentagrophytes]
MSREAYQVPSLTQQGPTSTSTAGATTGNEVLSVVYICGDCSSRVSMKRNDQIRCKECGHRVLYKERTKRMVQFQAR